ncbi:MAG TPA: DUF885 domain-containing protein, partial [Opitutus sp.]|nr:DUF885 domain-containing protein [Opitutus sp.]
TECIESLLEARPETATQLGEHRFDDRLTDYSAAALAAREAALRAQIAALEKIDAAALTGANRIDAQILRLELGSMLFVLTEEKPHTWNPLPYNDSLANSIYLLTAREFAPAEMRLRSAAKRLEAIPRVVAQIKATLKNPPRIHTETAIQQTAGAIALVREELEPLLAQAPSMREELAPAQAVAVAALEDYKAWLEREVLPKANGEFRLGEEKFRKKLRFALDSELAPDEILRRAERELETTTKAMYATARPLFENYFPAASTAEREDRPRVIKAVLDRLAEQRPTDATVVARATEITEAATAFVREKNLVTVPETPLKIIVLPEFQRGVAIAYCDSPGALESEGETYFAVSPTPANWTEARRVSFFREYNDYMLHDLAVHEAMPGHYLQIAHANAFRAPTLVRAVFASGTFIEGWAVYAEHVMADAGFGGPEVKLQQLKMRLRAIINAILDNKVHTAGMTEKEALDMMIRRGFQEEGEAVGKWRRACQSSTQLSTYFVGAAEHDDMRAAAERKEGTAFDLKRYHDRVLSFGSPAVKYVRQELGW